MYDKKEIINDLQKRLDLNRFIHSISVASISKELAIFYNLNFENSFIAGLLHDYAKCIDQKELYIMSKKYNINYKNYDFDDIKNILHANVGAYIVKEKYNVNDEIFNAIFTHTTADSNMTDIQKIVFISDFIEPFRFNIDNQEYFTKLSYFDLDKCVFEILNYTISYLKSKNQKIFYKTIEAYNFYKNKFSLY